MPFLLHNLDYFILSQFLIYNLKLEFYFEWKYSPFISQTKPQRLNLTGKLYNKIKTDVSNQIINNL